MNQIYASLIIKGEKQIEDVPTRNKKEVQAILDNK
ncbi:CD1375 family protein [Paenibacillus sp. Marseille-Q4541]|nr:CD1375 family protein [Paenibacillus sp. Marseille-Q4541]